MWSASLEPIKHAGNFTVMSQETKDGPSIVFEQKKKRMSGLNRKDRIKERKDKLRKKEKKDVLQVNL